MRKHILVVIFLVLFAVLCFLNHPVTDPADFTGLWYSADDQNPYLFHEGIISCVTNGSEEPVFRGAYSFAGETIALFVTDITGLQKVKELVLIENKTEYFLRDDTDEYQKIYFIRAK